MGDDRRDGSSARSEFGTDGPVRSIAKALRLAVAGDRIDIEPTDEPYRESVALMGSKHSGSLVEPFVIDGHGAVLDGSATIPALGWEHHFGDVFSYAPARLGHQQLFIDGRPALRHPADRASDRVPALEPREWCFWDSKIFFRVEPGRLPDTYEPACAALKTGLTLYYVHDVIIKDLVIQGFQTDGIEANDVVRQTALIGITSRANGRSGICVAGSSRVDIDKCLLVDNGETQLLSEGYSHTRVERTRITANTAPAITIEGGEVSVQESPPDAEVDSPGAESASRSPRAARSAGGRAQRESQPQRGVRLTGR